jgi:hypothetical protein
VSCWGVDDKRRGETGGAKTAFVSDLTGAESDEKNGATLTIRYADARCAQVGLDANAHEVENLAGKGTMQARRAHRPRAGA